MIDKKSENIHIQSNAEIMNIILRNNIVKSDTAEIVQQIDFVKGSSVKKLNFIAEDLQNWDSSLLSFVWHVCQKAKQSAIQIDISKLPDNLQELLKLADADDRKPNKKTADDLSLVEKVGQKTINIYKDIRKVLTYMRKVNASLLRFFTARSVARKIDFFAALNDCGPKAVPIVLLISFLVGLILAFVGAVQLQTFGAQIYVASLVTIGMCRIMGAIMVGIIIAGRTGSAYAATIGTMQVNEELDALETMGISKTDFLVLPRLFALIISMPILTMISDFAGMIGGAFVGVFLMGLPNQEYWKYAFNAFTLNNFLVGIFHGFCFGIIIALSGCYSGLTCGRNADSVGVATTNSVVNSIVYMIIATGIITVIFMELGI